MKSLDTFDFTAIPSLNKMLVLELARCEYILRRDNIIALGNSGTGKTHIGLSLGLAACQKGFSVAFTTAAGRLIWSRCGIRSDRSMEWVSAIRSAPISPLLKDEASMRAPAAAS